MCECVCGCHNIVAEHMIASAKVAAMPSHIKADIGIDTFSIL